MIPLFLGLAFGHGVDHDQVLIDVDAHKARVTLTPRVSTFPDADDDGDGTLSIQEIRANRSYIDDVVADGFQLVDHQGRSGTVTFADVVRPHDFGHGHGGGHLRVIQHHTFPSDVHSVEATVSLFGPESHEARVVVQLHDAPVRTFRVQAPVGRVVVEQAPATTEAMPGREMAGQLVVTGGACTLGAAAGLGLLMGRRREWSAIGG